jgi:mono/diheme cytochrome c family protein
MTRQTFLASVLLFVLAATAQAQSLRIADRQSASTVSARELLASPLARTVTITDDAVYRRTMTYRAIPVAELLKGLAVGPDDYVDLIASDRFSIGVPARLLVRETTPQALLAIEDPATPWPALPGKGRSSAGPFFVVWRDARPGEISSEYWAYKLAALEVADSPYRRWPELDVDSAVPATDPARRGLDRYVALCIACHRYRGAGNGEQGPDLGRPMNPVDYFQPQALRRLLRDPKAVRDWPDRRMPGFGPDVLSDEDLEALLAWLTYKARR